MAGRGRRENHASEGCQERDRIESIYLHYDGIKKTPPFRIADYGDDGALTAHQIQTLVERCDLDEHLAQELSILLGYSLDVDSEVGLVRVKRAQTGKRKAAARDDFTIALIDDDGSDVLVKPYDKRRVQDARRLTVIESCCYIWLDAGRALTITTRADRISAEQRQGALVDFIQSVIAMVTTPSRNISGETLRRDIEQVRRRFRCRGDLPAN